MRTDKELLDFVEKNGIHWTGKAAYIDGRIYGTPDLRQAINSAIETDATKLSTKPDDLVDTGYSRRHPSDVMVNINNPSFSDINSLIDSQAFPDKT